MATPFTVHTTKSSGEWTTVCGTSIDISGTEQFILADIAGNSYLVKSISIHHEKGDKWVQVLNGSTLQIGPFEIGYNKHWEKVFESGMIFDGVVNIEAESTGLCSVIVEYRIVKS